MNLKYLLGQTEYTAAKDAWILKRTDQEQEQTLFVILK